MVDIILAIGFALVSCIHFSKARWFKGILCVLLCVLAVATALSVPNAEHVLVVGAILLILTELWRRRAATGRKVFRCVPDDLTTAAFSSRDWIPVSKAGNQEQLR